MYELAKAKALGDEPKYIINRSGVRTAVGYGLTKTDLRRLYADQGFNISKNEKLIDEHIKNWIIARLALVADNRIFFMFNDGLDDGEAIHNLKVSGLGELEIIGIDFVTTDTASGAKA